MPLVHTFCRMNTMQRLPGLALHWKCILRFMSFGRGGAQLATCFHTGSLLVLSVDPEDVGYIFSETSIGFQRIRRCYIPEDNSSSQRLWEPQIPGHWIGLSVPQCWPSRSPDTSPPHFCFGGLLKHPVYQQNRATYSTRCVVPSPSGCSL